jgi:hypothetical protein
VAACVALGVPEITQVVAFTLAQAGSAVVGTLISQAEIVAPLLFKVVGVTAIAVPFVPEVPVDPE